VSSLLAVLALTVPPPADTPHPTAANDYLIVFAGDYTPYRPTKGHTFIALVRVETAPGCPPRVSDFHSLSWLPVTMKIRALAMRAEQGRNVPLDETLAYCLQAGGHVCAWGPYLVRPELAATIRERIATVEGQFRYKGGCFLSPRNVCDCARSVEEMLRSDRRFIGVCGYGAAAASSVVRTFSPGLVEPHQTHVWVGTLLGLDEYPLIWRAFGDYTSRRDQLKAARRP
jgi:hypothetical protein